MRVLLSSEHTYPAHNGVSFGQRPKQFPSGSAHHLHDLLAKGLADLGHEVLYYLPGGVTAPLPSGVRHVTKPDAQVDIYHNLAFKGEEVIEYFKSLGRPWITSCHVDRATRQERGWKVEPNWVFPSKTLAHSHQSERYVLNGLDPSNYIFSREKQDYFLFMSAVERVWDKGIEVAFEIARRTGIRLVVAGTGLTEPPIQELARVCREHNAEYIGDVQGVEKANLFAGAKAFLFPTRLNEAFGLVMVEALLSGTPVIASNKGACPEVLADSVGFLCDTEEDYLRAVERLPEIRPEACRDYALDRFDYRRMTADYLREYEKEIASARGELCITAS